MVIITHNVSRKRSLEPRCRRAASLKCLACRSGYACAYVPATCNKALTGHSLTVSPSQPYSGMTRFQIW